MSTAAEQTAGALWLSEQLLEKPPPLPADISHIQSLSEGIFRMREENAEPFGILLSYVDALGLKGQ